jgi:hypothetical protein
LTKDTHVDNGPQNNSKQGGGSNSNWSQTPPPAAIWTTTKQSMSYITVRGIESDTSWPVHDWPKQSVKELISNAYDFLRDYYPDGDKERRKIAVSVSFDSIPDEDSLSVEDKNRTVFRIAVRNSNVDRIPVFGNLEAIFDYTQFYSTKRNQHREVSGALGDYLKRALGMGYALWTNGYNRETHIANTKQWSEPIVLRYNGQEHKVFLSVDWDNQAYGSVFETPIRCKGLDFTEVLVTIPIDYILKINSDHSMQWILGEVKGYFNRNKIGNTIIDFSFSAEGL